MLIIIRNIPQDTVKREIADHFQAALPNGFFSLLRKKNHIVTVDIVCRNDPLSDSLECDGLVRVEPDDAALRVIKRLHGKKFKGRHLAVRKYHIRSWQKDPRVKAVNSTLNFKDRRQGERRRTNLKSFKIKVPEIQGLEVFHRSY